MFTESRRFWATQNKVPCLQNHQRTLKWTSMTMLENSEHLLLYNASTWKIFVATFWASHLAKSFTRPYSNCKGYFHYKKDAVDISISKHARHKQQKTARLYPLLSYKSCQKKHSKDSYYSIISSLVDTYYCLIWACFESVALKTGPGVILTSAVLRTSKNSRIKACVHWENANWLNRCAQHLLFSPPRIRRTNQPFFVGTRVKMAFFPFFFSAGPFAISRDHYIFLERAKTDGVSLPRQNKRCCFHHLRIFQELKFCSASQFVKVRRVSSARCEEVSESEWASHLGS